MPTNTNEQAAAYNTPNYATGYLVTTSATAAAATITVGFIPKCIRLHNLTDRISEEWFKGMDEMALYASIAGVNAKLDADGGVTDTNFAALWNPASASVADLRAALIGLAAKLDLDAGVTDTNYTALWTPSTLPSTMTAVRASLVGINAKLDADAGVTDTTYGSLWNVVAPALHTVAAGTRTLALTNGPLNNLDGTFTLSAAALIASKTFAWEAIG